MSALLYQLLTSTDNGNILSDVVRDLHDGGKTPEHATSTAESLWDILMKAGVNQRSGCFIFVVDSLDECDNWKVFIDCLSSHFGKHSKKDKPYLKFIITGRPYTSLQTRFRGMQTLTLNLETESQAICSDLELVARGGGGQAGIDMGVVPSITNETSGKIDQAGRSIVPLETNCFR
jgi:hypothetical protein